MKTWAIYAYDVWGNAKDGYNVNGRHIQRTYVTLEGEDEEARMNKEMIDQFGPGVELESGDDEVGYYSDPKGIPVGEVIMTKEW
jgi:hypothetical protein